MVPSAASSSATHPSPSRFPARRSSRRAACSLRARSSGVSWGWRRAKEQALNEGPEPWHSVACSTSRCSSGGGIWHHQGQNLLFCPRKPRGQTKHLPPHSRALGHPRGAAEPPPTSLWTWYHESPHTWLMGGDVPSLACRVLLAGLQPLSPPHLRAQGKLPWRPTLDLPFSGSGDSAIPPPPGPVFSPPATYLWAPGRGNPEARCGWEGAPVDS